LEGEWGEEEKEGEVDGAANERCIQHLLDLLK